MPVSNTQFYGINKGGAQVIDPTSGAQQGFAQMLARQQQQRQQELKQLTDQQAQLKPDGLRNDADRQDFFNQVQDWRNKSIGAMNERDPYKKSLAQSQAQQAYMQAQNTVAKSKQAAATWAPVASVLADPTKRYEYGDDAVKEFMANNQRGVNDKAYNPNPYSLKSAPDIDYFNKNTKAINDGLINNAVKTVTLGPVSKDGVGNPIQYQTEGQKIDPMAENGLAHQIANRASFINGVPVDARYFNALKGRNADLFADVKSEDDMHNAINLAAAREAHQGQLYKPGASSIYKNGETDTDKLQLAKDKWDYEGKHPHITFGQIQNQQPLPFEHNYVAPIQKGGVPAINNVLKLASPAQFRDGEKPVATVTPDGMYKIDVPDQVDLKKNGQDIIKANKEAKADYEKAGGTEGSLWWKKKVPWEQSQAYKDLTDDESNNPYVTKKSGEPIYMDPGNPIDIQTKAQLLADRLHIPVDKINTMLGGTGKHGLNTDIKQQLSNPQKTVKPTKGNPLGLNLP
jgi:hypothetical protein